MDDGTSTLEVALLAASTIAAFLAALVAWLAVRDARRFRHEERTLGEIDRLERVADLLGELGDVAHRIDYGEKRHEARLAAARAKLHFALLLARGDLPKSFALLDAAPDEVGKDLPAALTEVTAEMETLMPKGSRMVAALLGRTTPYC